ncbi:hypothetical protein [Ktedonobacter sp. SOSP1-52]|uniref:hypothetical protein n=1 Tax=Ktedonobacter sp. SOSP1-52 TaxID=2778366 RepID=UPI0019150B0A|nr:hypothetical protein [Ktedonobacter sp. SOSP1-52]
MERLPHQPLLHAEHHLLITSNEMVQVLRCAFPFLSDDICPYIELALENHKQEFEQTVSWWWNE